MKIEIVIPVAGVFRNSNMWYERFAVLGMARVFDIPSFEADQAELALSVSSTETLAEGGWLDRPFSYYLIDGRSYRKTDGVRVDGGPIAFDLVLGGHEQHPFFERAAEPIRKAVRAYVGENRSMEHVFPPGLSAHLAPKTRGDPYRIEATDGAGPEWLPKSASDIERQLFDFESWIARFACVDGELFVREELPLVAINGDADGIEPVRRRDPGDTASTMNAGEGFEPKTNGYFDMSELAEAIAFCEAGDDGWCAMPKFTVDAIGPGFRASGVEDMTAVDLAASMARRFERRLSVMEFSEAKSLEETRSALTAISRQSFSRYKDLTDGLAADMRGLDVGPLADAVAYIVSDETMREQFFLSRRHADIAERAIARRDLEPIWIADVA